MESEFSTKFNLLNSQQSSQDIIWSSSDSDSENVTKHVQLEKFTVKIGLRKRKRSKTSGNKRKNLPFLDITFSDSVIERGISKSREENESTSKECLSPILNNSLLKSRNTNTLDIAFSDSVREKMFPKITEVYESTSRECNSPILNITQLKSRYTNVNISPKPKPKTSPILCSQNLTTKSAVKVRKNLFNSDLGLNSSKETNIVIKSTKNVYETMSIITGDRKHSCNKNIQSVTTSDVYHDKNKKIFEDRQKINNGSISKGITFDDANNINDAHTLNKEFSKSTTLRTTTLQNKVESYFKNNFNTQLLSQHSISEYESTPTNSSKTSEEIDNISLTQERPHSREVVENSPKHLETTSKLKKIKYKKDGLAYKLNSLLKKQNANISLWQHERFLALNSNFIIPAGEYTAFRIQNIQFKYGVYLLEGKDVNNEEYVILINSSLVNERQIKRDIILKLYVPYKILIIENNSKLIVNASKFEFKDVLL